MLTITHTNTFYRETVCASTLGLFRKVDGGSTYTPQFYEYGWLKAVYSYSKIADENTFEAKS